MSFFHNCYTFCRLNDQSVKRVNRPNKTRVMAILTYSAVHLDSASSAGLDESTRGPREKNICCLALIDPHPQATRFVHCVCTLSP